jgi:hypothetical protein
VSVRIAIVEPAGMARYAEQIRDLERSITYPIAGGADRFWIDHGPGYSGFFEGLGEAGFMLALDGDRVIGMVAGAFREVGGPAGKAVPAMYGGDFKIRREARGTGLGRRMFLRGLWAMFFDRDRVRPWKLAFGAAMQGDRGDVTRSYARPFHPGRLGSPLAELAMAFCPVDRLRDLPDGPGAPAGGCDLGVRRARPPWERTDGRKDLRLVSTGEPWPLVHLPAAPDQWGAGVGAWLRTASAGLADSDIACFAIDRRLAAPLAWLTEHGVPTGTRAIVYAFARPPGGLGAWRRAPWVHLPTSEI